MFKAGDKIRCIKRVYGNETVGKIYTVLKMNYNNDVWIVADDNGSPNSYSPKQFKLATPKADNDLSEFGSLFYQGEEHEAST